MRMVLLKQVDARGFVFFTNAESQKGRELKENPVAAMCFHWKTQHRQVRVEGTVTELPGVGGGCVLREPVAGESVGGGGVAAEPAAGEPGCAG